MRTLWFDVAVKVVQRRAASAVRPESTMVTIDVERLVDGPIHLRRLTLNDVDEWLAGQDDEQIRWFEFSRPAERADVERAITNWMQSWRTDGAVRHWAICETDTDRIAGGVELRLQGDEVNLSYVVFPTFRRRGYALRAAGLALDYAAEVLRASAAVIKVLDGNEPSLAVSRQLGATPAGTTPSDAGGTFVVHRLELAVRTMTSRPVDVDRSGTAGVRSTWELSMSEMAVDVVVVQHAHKQPGPGDVGLSAEGRQQAVAVADVIAERFPRVVSMWSSPQRRALETASPIAAALDLTIQIDDRFRERMSWESVSSLAFDEFLAEWRQATADRSFQPSSGDSSLGAAERYLEAIRDVAARAGSGPVVVISHGGVTVDALRTVAGDAAVRTADPALEHEGIPNCAITRLRVTDGAVSIVSYPALPTERS